MEPAFHRVSPIEMRGGVAKRLMIIFHTQGCEFAQKTGGCTMCGFSEHDSCGVTDNDLSGQLEFVLSRVESAELRQLELLTVASFFNDDRVSPEFRRYALSRAGAFQGLRKVSVESRAEFLTPAKLVEAKALLPRCTLEVGIGIESANDYIRNFALKKGLTREALDSAVGALAAAGAAFLGYLFLKPPFLSESQAVEDAVESLRYVFELGRRHNVETRASLAPGFVVKGTALDRLYKEKLYAPVSLWSVREVILRAESLGNTFLALSQEDLTVVAMPESCPRCQHEFYGMLEEYNGTRDSGRLRAFHCECKKDYDRMLAENSR